MKNIWLLHFIALVGAIVLSTAYAGSYDSKHGHGVSSQFEESDSSSFGGDHHLSDGGKDVKGQKSEHSFNKGEKGSHGKDESSHYFDEEGGQKKSSIDEENISGSNHESSKGLKGGKTGQNKGHKKGSKTTGYHNKYNKDDYHKEQKFYDDEHKGGSHKKFGNDHEFHNSEGEDHKKGTHHGSGHKQDSFSKKGNTDTGHYDADHKGHKGSHGFETHHFHNEGYGKKGGSSGGNENGYKSGGGGKNHN